MHGEILRLLLLHGRHAHVIVRGAKFVRHGNGVQHVARYGKQFVKRWGGR